MRTFLLQLVVTTIISFLLVFFAMPWLQKRYAYWQLYLKMKHAAKKVRKLDAQIANAMMSINAVKAVEIGDGILASRVLGFDNNDQIRKSGFKTNHSGGILGGISNGDDINVKVYFKATPSIFIEQETVDIYGNEVECKLKGRHDPCVAIRGSVVAESMTALVLVDMLLLNMSSKVENIKKVYAK